MKIALVGLLLMSGSLFGGDLARLQEKPWESWFSAHSNRKFEFAVNRYGVASLIPMERRGERTSSKYWITFTPVIEEVEANGKVTKKDTQKEEFTALSEPSTEAEKISYQGKVKSGAKFEVHFEIDKGAITVGGHLVEKGDTENAERFTMRVKIPNVYYSVENEDKLEKIAKRDKIQLLLADGKKVKVDAFEDVWAEKEDFTGPGITEARVDLDGFKAGRLELESGDMGLFDCWNAKNQPLYKGFTFIWRPDAQKDPEGKGRFVFKIK